MKKSPPLALNFLMLSLTAISCNSKEEFTFSNKNPDPLPDNSNSGGNPAACTTAPTSIPDITIPLISDLRFRGFSSEGSYTLSDYYTASPVEYFKYNNAEGGDATLSTAGNANHFLFINNPLRTNIYLGNGNDTIYLANFDGSGNIVIPSGNKTIILRHATLRENTISTVDANLTFYLAKKVFPHALSLTKGKTTLVLPKSLSYHDLIFTDELDHVAILIGPQQDGDIGNIPIFKIKKENGFDTIDDVRDCSLFRYGDIVDHNIGTYLPEGLTQFPDRDLLRKDLYYPSVIQYTNSSMIAYRDNPSIPISLLYRPEEHPDLDGASDFSTSLGFTPFFSPAIENMDSFSNDYIYGYAAGKIYVEADSRSINHFGPYFDTCNDGPGFRFFCGVDLSYKMSEYSNISWTSPFWYRISTVELNKGSTGIGDVQLNSNANLILRKYGNFFVFKPKDTNFAFYLADNITYSDLIFTEDATYVYIKLEDDNGNRVTILTVEKGTFTLAQIIDSARFDSTGNRITIGPDV